MVTTDSCCHCCSLKTGTIIIGVIGIVSSILSLIEDLVAVSVGEGDTEEDLNLDPETREIMEKMQLAVNIVTLFTMLVELVLCILLVYGAVKEKPRFIKPWIYYSIVCLVIVDITLAVVIIFCLLTGMIAAGVAILVATVICTLVVVYLIVVVNSYHRQLLGIDLRVMPVKV